MRPNVSDDVADRLEELVDEEARLPASSLTFEDRLEYLLDTFEGYRTTCGRQSDRIDHLERELEEAKREDTDDTPTVGEDRRW